jgi:hypothetical protein
VRQSGTQEKTAEEERGLPRSLYGVSKSFCSKKGRAANHNNRQNDVLILIRLQFPAQPVSEFPDFIRQVVELGLLRDKAT